VTVHADLFKLRNYLKLNIILSKAKFLKPDRMTGHSEICQTNWQLNINLVYTKSVALIPRYNLLHTVTAQKSILLQIGLTC